jgi:hypothetical protein
MADLRPIGSEKLTGQDKINRIMEIARFKEAIPKTINETAKSEYSVALADGNKYEIVKERQGYIIKKTISESETDYIEPMKNRKYYSSYSQAFKRLNLLAGELNRINENEEGVSLYGEQKKFVLKTPKADVPVPAPVEPAPAPVAPPAVPSPELPPSPIDGGEDMGMEDMGGEEMAPEDDIEDIDVDVDVDTDKGGDDEEHVTFKSIQKLTGKLTQKIRTLDSEEGMTSEDIKYVINMVISALDLKSLSEEDKEDIMSKFEEDSEDMGSDDMSGDDMGGEDLTDDSEVEDIQADMDVPVESVMDEEDYGHGAIFDSIFGESKIDKVISKYFEVSKKEIREQKEKNVQQTLKKKSEVKKIMESVVKMTETIEQELAAKKFLQENLDSKFIGITNKKNLVFENKGGQVKISPNGDLL